MTWHNTTWHDTTLHETTRRYMKRRDSKSRINKWQDNDTAKPAPPDNTRQTRAQAPQHPYAHVPRQTYVSHSYVVPHMCHICGTSCDTYVTHMKFVSQLDKVCGNAPTVCMCDIEFAHAHYNRETHNSPATTVRLVLCWTQLAYTHMLLPQNDIIGGSQPLGRAAKQRVGTQCTAWVTDLRTL